MDTINDNKDNINITNNNELIHQNQPEDILIDKYINMIKKDKLDLLEDCILNVNIPYGEVKGTKITVLGERIYENSLEERISPRGKRYFWISGEVKTVEQHPDSDITAIEEGYITITPVNIDMTNNKKIDILKDKLL